MVSDRFHPFSGTAASWASPQGHSNEHCLPDPRSDYETPPHACTAPGPRHAPHASRGVRRPAASIHARHCAPPAASIIPLPKARCPPTIATKICWSNGGDSSEIRIAQHRPPGDGVRGDEEEGPAGALPAARPRYSRLQS